MQALRKLDDYFIGNNEGTAADRVWFYGSYALTAALALATMVAL